MLGHVHQCSWNNSFGFTVFMATYLIIEWAKEANHEYNRKNPKDYENDT